MERRETVGSPVPIGLGRGGYNGEPTPAGRGGYQVASRSEQHQCEVG